MEGTLRHRAIVRRAGTAEVTLVPTAAVVPGSILVAPRVVGLCGTDLQMLRRQRHDPAAILGHEGMAEILAVGAGIEPPLVPGQMVVMNPTHARRPGYLLGHTVDGMMQERLLIPPEAALEGLVMPLAAPVPRYLTALIEPLAAIRYSLELVRQRHEPRSVLIYGDGIVGHLWLVLARRVLGRRVHVTLFHHSPQGVDWSMRSGLAGDDNPIGPGDGAGAAVHSGMGADTAILCTPRSAAMACLDHALDAVADGGVIDLFGGFKAGDVAQRLPGVDLSAIRGANCGGDPHPGVIADEMALGGKRVALLGHRGVSAEHLSAAAAELAAHPGLYAPLVTHVASLDGAASILRDLCAGGGRMVGGRRFVKLVIDLEKTGGGIEFIEDLNFNRPELQPGGHLDGRT